MSVLGIDKGGEQIDRFDRSLSRNAVAFADIIAIRLHPVWVDAPFDAELLRRRRGELVHRGFL